MDRLERYREAVIQLIREYAGLRPANGKIESEAIIDRERDHYEVVHVGWQGRDRIHGCVLHIDIRDGKIWLQHNGTDRLIADELMEAGVRREDIVLGFQPPALRPFTDFAVG
jgi:hypothetical protein